MHVAVKNRNGVLTGAVTDEKGFYAVRVPGQDSLAVVYSLVGYQTFTCQVRPMHHSAVDVNLTPGQTLTGVTVCAKSLQSGFRSADMSRIELSMAQLRKMPAFLGERDVLRVLQLMPGVQKGTEGQTGLYVRGGGADQNLIMLDQAVVYNPSHLFGFFSPFSGDALSGVTLTKGGFPARYGGRLSSVLDMTLKEGNSDRLHGEAGIGLIASRLTLDGPLVKGRSGKAAPLTFALSARRTYYDLLMKGLAQAGVSNPLPVDYYFYDATGKLSLTINARNKILLSGYLGRDRFGSQQATNHNTTNLTWGNAVGSLQWNQQISSVLTGNLALLLSHYRLDNNTDQESTAGTSDVYSLRYRSGIRDYSLKYDLVYKPAAGHLLRLGLQSTAHRFSPSAAVTRRGDATQGALAPPIDALESGLYVDEGWQPFRWLQLTGGVRLSHYWQGSTQYRNYEPRLSLAVTVSPTLSLKTAYTGMNQYVHMLSSSSIGMPNDLWVPSTARVAPQQARQVAVGLVKNLPHAGLTVTLEGYHKSMEHVISYREGADFSLTTTRGGSTGTNWQDNVTAGRGWSYGMEAMVQKKAGRFSGWAGYTLAWTQWQFADINGGKPFYPRYDRRHDVSLVGIYELTKSITLSGTWVYGTGNALTMPQTRYSSYQLTSTDPSGASADGTPAGLQNYRLMIDYGGQKNSFRADAYHRLDLGIQFRQRRKRTERSWQFSLYNAYNRRNLFFYQLDVIAQGKDQPNRLALVRYSTFPVIPSFSYSMRF
ncbi:TonB-dependent receptor [Spirosoma luteolum]